MNTGFSFQRLASVARKEFLHIIRDPATLFFALFIPVLELFMLGYAIDTNVGNALALRESLATVIKDQPLPVEARPRILFNPDTRSANFFIPGLMVVMCQMMAIMLSANAIVREKENGTLEQLFMTPVKASELILGKLIPYLVLTLVEFCTILFFMNTVFAVPIRGYVFTLLALTLPFVFSMLGIGLWISTRVSTREAAGQAAMGTMMPSIF